MTRITIECSDEIAQRWEACFAGLDQMFKQVNSEGVKMNMGKADALLLMGIEGFEGAINKVFDEI